MKKKVFSVTLALAMAASLAACSGSSGTGGQTNAPAGNQAENKTKAEEGLTGEGGIVTALSGPVTVEFWHSISNTSHAPILEQLVKDFNEGRGKELGITVNMTFQGSGSDLYNNIIGALKAKNAPDVTMSTPFFTSEYIQSGAVVNLEPYVKDSNVGISDFDDILESFRNEGYGYSQEGLYSLPVHKASEVLYYNKTFFEENNLKVPATWDEMVDVSKQIYDITGKPAFGWDNLWSAFMTLSLQKGGRYADKEGILYFLDDPVSLEVLNFYKEQIDAGIWRTAGEDNFFSGPFANEIVPMYIGVSVEASYINQKNPDIVWDAAPVPQMDSEKPFVSTEGHCLTVLNQNGNQEQIYAAYEFVKFLTSYEANLATVQGSGYLPIRKSVLDSQEYKDYLEQSQDHAQTASNAQISAYYSPTVYITDSYTTKGVGDATKTMMENVLMNGQDPAEALKQLGTSLGVN